MKKENDMDKNDNWRQKVDDFIRKSEEARLKKRKQEEEAKRREDEKWFEKWRKIYKCHICGKGSEGPRMIDTDEYGRTEKPDWSRPKDLTACIRCRKWTCARDIHRNICQKCAKKL